MAFAGVCEEARGLLPEAVELRRRLHRDPELGLHLPRTQDAVLEALDHLPLEVETGETTSSVVATLTGDAPGRTILLRGDMDALPLREDTGLDFASVNEGRMHACGHDAHVAMLAGAARLLSDRRGELHGKVKFMFQPGEEGHHGARYMLEEGLLDGGVDGAFAIHASPTFRDGMIAGRPGPVMASADVVTVTLTGKGGHASSPHTAIDPIPVACEIVQALQTLMTRRIDVFDPAVLTIAKIEAGTTSNIIPETATLMGTIRAMSEKARARVHDGIRRVAEGVASAHDVDASVQLDIGYPVTVNDDDFAAYALGVGRRLLGDDMVRDMPAPIMGAEDFSYVLQQVPGAMVFLGTRPQGMKVAPAAHSNRYLLEEDAMAAGIAMYSAVALDFLSRAS